MSERPFKPPLQRCPPRSGHDSEPSACPLSATSGRWRALAPPKGAFALSFYLRLAQLRLNGQKRLCATLPDLMSAPPTERSMSPSPILVIDDSGTMLAILDHLLRSRGHEVITARDGVEGVKAAASKVPNLILCDIEMPGLDGFGVVRQLAASAVTREIPVVALTGLTSAKELKRIESAGFAGSISKTSDPTQLSPLIETFLS